jgi:hypothetical protein
LEGKSTDRTWIIHRIQLGCVLELNNLSNHVRWQQ